MLMTEEVLHDGYTSIRRRTRPEPAMQPRPRFTIVVTDSDEAKLRVLLRERSCEGDTALVSCLEVALSYALVVAPHRIAPDIVTMNSQVLYEDEREARASLARLVYSQRAQHGNRVPVLSPLGVALLGARVGQTVIWSSPNRRVRRLRVTGLPYQPERSGDLQL
jgi:regulator of nucleoside diphosphate kinase